MSKIYVSEEEYKALQRDVEQLKNQLDSCVVKEWYQSEGLLEIDSYVMSRHKKLTLRSNYETWERCLGQKETMSVFYMCIDDMGSGENYGSIGLTLKQMKKVSDYLVHKINYLEGVECE